MKSLVLIDFDGTLYKKDSLLEFTKFYKGNWNFFIGILILSPILILMKLGVFTNEYAKKKYIEYFFKNENYNYFLGKAKVFGETKISQNLDSKIFNLLQKHIQNQDTIYIVTASFSEWIISWADAYFIKIISTNFEVINETLTGNFTTRNCNGLEKVNRIKKEINLKDYTTIYVYGKGEGDFEMLQLANKSFSNEII